MKYPYIKLFFSAKVFSNPYLAKNKPWMKYVPFLSGFLVCRHAYNIRKKTRNKIGIK